MYTGLLQFGLRGVYKPVLPSLQPMLLLVSVSNRNSREQTPFERLVIAQLVKISSASGKSPIVHYHFNKYMASDFKQKHSIIAF
jgi:hypothetical protein